VYSTIGCSDFDLFYRKWIMPRRKLMPNLIPRHIRARGLSCFEPLRAHLAPELPKSGYTAKLFFPLSMGDVKNAKLDANFT
jgi:hypothetical protein